MMMVAPLRRRRPREGPPRRWERGRSRTPTAGNVIGEIPGREHPEEVVVIGGHIDSWDVGQGAQDDGAAIMDSLEALLLIKKLGCSRGAPCAWCSG